MSNYHRRENFRALGDTIILNDKLGALGAKRKRKRDENGRPAIDNRKTRQEHAGLVHNLEVMKEGIRPVPEKVLTPHVQNELIDAPEWAVQNIGQERRDHKRKTGKYADAQIIRENLERVKAYNVMRRELEVRRRTKALPSVIKKAQKALEHFKATLPPQALEYANKTAAQN